MGSNFENKNLFEAAEQFLELMNIARNQQPKLVRNTTYQHRSMPKYNFGVEFRGEPRDYMLYGVKAKDWIGDGGKLIELEINLAQMLNEISDGYISPFFYDLGLRGKSKDTRKKYLGRLADEPSAREDYFEESIFHSYSINQGLLAQGEDSAFIIKSIKNIAGKSYEEISDRFLKGYYPFYKHLKEHEPTSLEPYSLDIRFARIMFYVGVAQAICQYHREGKNVGDAISSKKKAIKCDLKSIERVRNDAKKLNPSGVLYNEENALQFEIDLNNELSWLNLFRNKKVGWANALLVIRLTHSLIKEIGFPEQQAVEVIFGIISIIDTDYEKESVRHWMKKYMAWYAESGLTVDKPVRPDALDCLFDK